MRRAISTRRWTWRVRLLVAVGVGLLLGAVALGGLKAGTFNGFRLQLTDTLFPGAATDPRVRVVAIDRQSLATVGLPWPWPRRLHTELVRELSRLGAELVVFDIVFDVPTEDDELLAVEVERSGRTILTTQAEPVFDPGARLGQAPSLSAPVRVLAEAAASVGHANIFPDPDGVVRLLPLILQRPGGSLHPALALAALMEAEGIEPVYTLRPSGVQVGNRFIPTQRFGNLELNFSPELQQGAKDAPVISAIDVLEGEAHREDVEGTIVMIGVTDPSLGDDRPTPVAKSVEMPGVLIHANALNTMLTNSYLRPVGDFRTATAATGLAAAVAALTLLGRVWMAPIGLVAAGSGYTGWVMIQFHSGRVLDLLYPMLAAVISFVAALGLRYFTEMRGRRRVSALFSQYVPKSVAHQLIEEGRVEEALGGERVELTVLFCDLRGFTAQSSELEPTRVRDLVDVYYDEMTRLVHDEGGTLLNFVGDEVFAVWGAPLPDPDSARRAVVCARAMQDAGDRINRRLAEDGLPAVAYGIGLHTGEVIAAHVGTEMRRQYTVLGDTVNCGARLCTVAGRGEIVVSQETYRQLDPQPPAEVLPGFRLKGVGRELFPHRLWPDELRDPTGQVRGKLEE